MTRNTLSILLTSFAVSVAMLCVACQADTPESSSQMPGEPIEFGALIRETDEVQTRALEYKYITSDPFNMDFYIQLCCDEEGTTQHSEFGTYVVPSSFEGRFQSKDTGNSLIWKDLTSPHTFYAWNIPWNEEYTPTSKDITEGIPIIFHNSAGGDDNNTHKNNAVYENFIGAKSAMPYSYKEHGKYVDLTFYHLVSKIKIGSFILIEPGGAIQKHLKADLTFVGMPTEAIFYPHPSDGGRPRVEIDENKVSKDNGVTYYIDNMETKDEFYICPEVDFSKIDFKIKITSKDYAQRDVYYGTFDNVEIIRDPGTDYDNVNGGDDKILHAGEMMTLNITLIPGIGPGLAIIISKWNTDAVVRESQYHTHSGMYSDAEIKEFIDLFFNQKSYNEDEIKEFVERLFEIYGSGKDANDKMIFQLYENVEYNSNILPIWKDCIIDGLGHIIKMKTNGNNTAYVTAPYFNVGPVRNIYLTDGTNTIYIDEDGYVWIEDANELSGYKKTNYVLEPLNGEEKSYDISCKDGQVHKSTYYNNSISGS